MILAHSPTAASQVTSDLSCHDVREERVVVVMTEIEAVEVERGAVEEGEKPTEEEGTLLDYTEALFLINFDLCSWGSNKMRISVSLASL